MKVHISFLKSMPVLKIDDLPVSPDGVVEIDREWIKKVVSHFYTPAILERLRPEIPREEFEEFRDKLMGLYRKFTDNKEIFYREFNGEEIDREYNLASAKLRTGATDEENSQYSLAYSQVLDKWTDACNKATEKANKEYDKAAADLMFQYLDENGDYSSVIILK